MAYEKKKKQLLNMSLLRLPRIRRLIFLGIKIFCVVMTLLISYYTLSDNGYIPSTYKNVYNYTSLYEYSGNPNREKILYISRHIGTKSNFWYIADSLNYNMDVLTPEYHFRKRPKCFDNGKCTSYIMELCNKYKYIVISDIIPDSHPFIVNKCKAKVILEVTNRFDLYVPVIHHKKYLKKFGKSIMDTDNIIIVTNNPYENFYACNRGIFFPKYFLIRPSGYAPPELINKPPKNKKKHDIVVINRTEDDKYFAKRELEKRNIKFDFLEQNYGGPLALTQYKAMIILPYQVSIMKMMENFRYGVAMLLPSEALFKKIAKNYFYLFPAKELFKVQNGLTKYVEFYNYEFRDLIVYFDSWDDIPKIIENVDFDKIKAKGKEFMKKYEKNILSQWRQVFGQEEERDAIINQKPVCENKFYNYANN